MQASSEDGLVACFDARKGAKSAPLYRLSAHDRPACALTFCTAVPGLLATASTDKQVFYSVLHTSSAAPSLPPPAPGFPCPPSAPPLPPPLPPPPLTCLHLLHHFSLCCTFWHGVNSFQRHRSTLSFTRPCILHFGTVCFCQMMYFTLGIVLASGGKAVGCLRFLRGWC